MKDRYILMSYDVEEFDMPLEYSHPISPEEQMRVGVAGLDALMPILLDGSKPATLFTTANFANTFPGKIRALSQHHEIASHTYYHSSFAVPDLLSSRLALETITGKQVTGLRMPRMRPVNMADVMDAGYHYDSSVNPTWLPGRYNNLHLSRLPYMDNGMLRVPASVTPLCRIPLFWLSFKNFSPVLFRQLCKRTLHKDGHICLYFHPWEFTDIKGYGLPAYTTRHAGKVLLDRLQELIRFLSLEGEFVTIESFNEIKKRQQ